MTDNQQRAARDGIQDEPIMDMHEVSGDDKVNGILNQERLDSAGGDPVDIEDSLRARFRDAGLDVDDDFIREQAQAIADRTNVSGYQNQEHEG